MSRKTLTPGERQRAYDLIKAHRRALIGGSDFSRPQHLGNPSDAAEEAVDEYLLTDNKDDLLQLNSGMVLLKKI